MADYEMLAEMGVPMPPPENLIMDEDLKLVGEMFIDWEARALAAEAALRSFGNYPDTWETLPDHAKLLLTVIGPKRGWKLPGLPWRMHELRRARAACRSICADDQRISTNRPDADTTITRLRDEIEALKSDVSDLVRAGSDEATENERLVKERDEANVRVRAITEVLNFSAEQTQKAEADFATATNCLSDMTALKIEAEAQRDAALEELRAIEKAAEADWVDVPRKPKTASRTLEGGEG